MRMLTAVVSGNEAVHSDSAAPVPWWSYTKTVIAAATLVLVVEGRLRLDGSVAGKPFSLRQLLQHRAGLPEYGALASYHAAVAAGDQPWTAEEMMDRVKADRLVFAPGEGWAYSNVGYYMIRRLMEAAAAAPLGDILARLVLGPLGIADVRLAMTPCDLDGIAWGNARGYHPGWVYHGLLVGPAHSAALLLHHLLNGRLLPPELLAVMCEAHSIGGALPDRPWRSTGYGLGLMIGEGVPPGRYIGHSGGGPGSTSAVYRMAGGTCTAAVFTGVEAQGSTERRAMELANA